LCEVDANTAVKQLFHFRESGDHHEITFSSLALFLFFVPYTIMAVVTLGNFDVFHDSFRF
jgi:hypothetical protein